jgi:hypothetical protein
MNEQRWSVEAFGPAGLAGSLHEMSSDLYWATLVRLPRWEPELGCRLQAAGIDPFRVPASKTTQPVEITMELFAHTRIDVQRQVWSALDDVFRLEPGDFLITQPMGGPPADRFHEREALHEADFRRC